MITPEQFVQAEIERTGKRLFTYAEVIEMTERWIVLKTAAALRASRVDALMGVRT